MNRESKTPKKKTSLGPPGPSPDTLLESRELQASESAPTPTESTPPKKKARRKPTSTALKSTTARDMRAHPPPQGAHVHVRRMHRRDINRAWEFLKLAFREVNRETVEYQRPRSKQRFVESYDDEGVEQLIFEIEGEVVGYAECAYEVTGDDNWINPRYFETRDMRPLFVEELATHPHLHGLGIGAFMLEQLQHLARVRGCTHLVLEVAENNDAALSFYRRRSFYKLDAAVFLAQKIEREKELLPPRPLAKKKPKA